MFILVLEWFRPVFLYYETGLINNFHGLIVYIPDTVTCAGQVLSVIPIEFAATPRSAAGCQRDN